MRLEGEKVFLRRLLASDAGELLDLRSRNQAFFQPFEPIQPTDHYTLEAQLAAIELAHVNWEKGLAYGFGICTAESARLIGRVNLANVVRGAWQNCTIGYFIDQSQNGQGFMTEAVKLAGRFAFDEAGLHRVQAGVMPHNVRSIRVLEKAGFRNEGLSKRYLNINGVWEDHLIFARTSEE
ncbi:N-acetyltransferase [Brevibacillus fluminis]|uniref:N-acetyltransferase n=1 Tax=Brevibacillus fluminis TaxID=511487 RepID=A0A3M8DY61_9BACL|nr:GNAT family protein [Brevibacillus fluminis]RNB91917.1 N-acetyltransferase [Brevibacillus fluminis]